MAFVGFLNPDDNSGATDSALFLYQNGTLMTVAGTSSPLSGFGFGTPSLNNAGQIAFLGTLDSSEDVLLIGGGNPITNRVIGVGDSLLGGTVTGILFDREGLNDNGQLAFTAFSSRLRQQSRWHLNPLPLS